jgi:RNA polymerase sigma-70 factor (ECF subfamily)
MADKPQIDWHRVVEEIRGGNPAGEEALYRELHSGARLFLCRRLGTNDVDDSVHDVFLIVVQAIRSGALREPERLMGFVRTVLYRQLHLSVSRIVGARETTSPMESASRLSNRDPTPEQLVLDREKIQTINKVMRKMKKKDVEILTRYYIRGQESERVCREMALTHDQFTQLKSRAKARLAGLIQRDKGKSDDA